MSPTCISGLRLHLDATGLDLHVDVAIFCLRLNSEMLSGVKPHFLSMRDASVNAQTQMSTPREQHELTQQTPTKNAWKDVSTGKCSFKSL
jgi:hypothetical protein